jgi:hypothetical protein
LSVKNGKFSVCELLKTSGGLALSAFSCGKETFLAICRNIECSRDDHGLQLTSSSFLDNLRTAVYIQFVHGIRIVKRLY